MPIHTYAFENLIILGELFAEGCAALDAVYHRAQGRLGLHMCADMCVDVCVDMCADMCVDVCVDMCADMRVRTCM